jgi:histidine decarboxylase
MVNPPTPNALVRRAGDSTHAALNAAHRTAIMAKLFQFNQWAPIGKSAGDLAPVFAQTEQRMRTAHANHLGYPYNLSFSPGVPAGLGQYLINNLGDPYAGSHYGSEVCDLEREALDWFMDLWECPDKHDFWGSIGASGTEGNFWGLYLGREALPDAVLIHSTEAHYSIPKAARILRTEAIHVAAKENGEIDLDVLAATLRGLGDRQVILALTCGTTMKGAHDDVAGVIARLDEAGITAERRYIHLDGALNAMVIPFAEGSPDSIRPSFKLPIDSISTSGHKMIGAPMPCGVLIARKRHVERIASNIAYLRSNDTTLMGSRNGHAVLAVWSRVMGHGLEGYRADVAGCLKRTELTAAALRAAGVPVLCNPFGMTIVFPQPSEAIVNRYQLACYRGEAHAIIMPNVTEALAAKFLANYLEWWAEPR